MKKTRTGLTPLVAILLLNALVYLFMIDQKSYSPSDPESHVPDYVTELVVADNFGTDILHNHEGSEDSSHESRCLRPETPAVTSFAAVNADYNSRIVHQLTVALSIPNLTNRMLRSLLRQRIRHGSSEDDAVPA
jgi:hypothetical protein